MLTGQQQQTSLEDLEATAKANDMGSFVAAVRRLNWAACEPGDFICAADAALYIGAFALAREIVENGRKRYPKDHALQKHAAILASPRILRDDARPDPAVGKNEAWLKKHAHDFRGRWVAVKNGKLLGSADALADLVRKGGKTSKALFTLID